MAAKQNDTALVVLDPSLIADFVAILQDVFRHGLPYEPDGWKHDARAILRSVLALYAKADDYQPATVSAPTPASLGLTVRGLRALQGWTQGQLADTAGLDRSYVSGLERGERNPTLAVITRLAGALGIRASTLLANAEHPRPRNPGRCPT